MYEELVSHLRECAKLDPSENTFAEAADAIEELLASCNNFEAAIKDLDQALDAAQSNLSEFLYWIPVTERLPEECGEYLVWANVRPDKDEDPVPFMIMSYFHAFYDNQFIVKNVTHWMPLPEPPKEDENGNS